MSYIENVIENLYLNFIEIFERISYRISGVFDLESPYSMFLPFLCIGFSIVIIISSIKGIKMLIWGI